MSDELRAFISVFLFVLIVLPFYRYFDRQEERIRREWPDSWKKKLMLLRWNTDPIQTEDQEQPQKDL